VGYSHSDAAGDGEPLGARARRSRRRGPGARTDTSPPLLSRSLLLLLSLQL